jgi:hypothetical protein
MPTTAEYARADARDILRWLLTERHRQLLMFAHMVRDGSALSAAALRNAAHAWEAVCLEAAQDAPSATETPVQPEVGSRDDRTSETPTETLLGGDLDGAAERLLEQALSEVRDGHDAIPTVGAALAALRIAAGELPPDELGFMFPDRDAACICPPDLLERGGFRGGCPVHNTLDNREETTHG